MYIYCLEDSSMISMSDEGLEKFLYQHFLQLQIIKQTI